MSRTRDELVSDHDTKKHQCWPPDGTPAFSHHWLDLEDNAPVVCLWAGAGWFAPGVEGVMSPGFAWGTGLTYLQPVEPMKVN